jgi:hypothetical protein
LCASDGFAGWFNGVWPGEGAIGHATDRRSGRRHRRGGEVADGMLHVEVVELVERTSTEEEDTSYVYLAPTTVISRMNHTKA